MKRVDGVVQGPEKSSILRSRQVFIVAGSMTALNRFGCWLATGASFALVACGGGEAIDADVEASMPVEVLWQQGCTSDLHQREREALVIRDADALRAAYDGSVGLDPENREEPAGLGAVDFDSKVVIAAFFGSGGCGLEATFVADELDDVVDVRFVVVTRGQGCIGPDSRAYPYGFAALPLVDKPYEVSFETQRSPDACSSGE